MKEYSDIYFTYTREILEKSGLDPWVTIQVFIRKGPGYVYGLDEAIDIIKQSGIQYVGGSIDALNDGDPYAAGEVVMTITGPLQLIVEFETIYLGIISSQTTIENDGDPINLKAIEKRMDAIVSLVGDRPVYYMGARHWHYKLDSLISQAALNGGAAGCSTSVIQPGMGTMPHVLPLVCGNTADAARLFDCHIDPSIKRVVLVDTFNKELTDAAATLTGLYSDMGDEDWDANTPGIRLDTCGENYGESCHTNGVSVELARKMRLALAGEYPEVTLCLSSGFADVNKVEHFIEAEHVLGMSLFDSLGVGQLWEGRSATADIVVVDEKSQSKAGRTAGDWQRLKEIKW